MHVVDARGKSCPMPIVLVSQAMRTAASGAKLLIQADDRAFPEDIRAWCKKNGHELVSIESHQGFFEARVRKA
jgi:tRNA 2-thiouridine synthesizing protein A